MINNLSLPDQISSNYKAAYPFPYTTIDNFFNSTILDIVKSELDKYDNWSYDPSAYVTAEQVNKFFTPHSANEDNMRIFRETAPFTNKVIEYLYSAEALNYLERLTGIQGLMPDPDLMGGGVHRILTDGKLNIHADFNIQPNRNIWRRINLLLYLNKDWQDEWGGDLELWDKDMSKCCVKVSPVFNRAVIFNITDDAYHGHPYPLKTPAGVNRDSLALYYYTLDRPEHEKAPFHPVLWKNI